MPKVAAIIQARMGSTRLPGKALMPLNGKPALQQMIERVQRAKGIDEIIVATTMNFEDHTILDLCVSMGIKYCQGAEHNVLGRVLYAAHANNVDIICDLTGDCPLVDHRHITQLIKIAKRGQKLWRQTVDYASNITPRSWPDGFDVQCYPTKALFKVWRYFQPLHHVGWNIAQHPEAFRIHKGLPAFPNLYWWPDLRLTLDTKKDYEVLSNIFQYFGDEDFTAQQAISLMHRRPEWQAINRNVRTKTPEEG